MKALWAQYSARIDAMSLRERFILFLTILVVLSFAIDSLFISPLLTEQKRLAQDVTRQADELKFIRVKLQAAYEAKKNDPSKPLREQLTDIRTQTQAIKQEIGSYLSQSSELTRLPALMERALRSHQEKLTVEKIATVDEEFVSLLPTTTVSPANAAGAKIAPAQTPSADLVLKVADAENQANLAQPSASVFRRGSVDVNVSGKYLDLLRYVDDLEKNLPTLRWGEMKLKADKGTTHLQMRVYLVAAGS